MMRLSPDRSYPLDDDRELRSALSGALRARDVRRYFVEVMVAAMNADGVVDERELHTLERILDEHELFCALPPHVAQQLIKAATDAFEFTRDVHARIEVIARNLTSRSHRLFAFAMACEVVAADADIADSERAYLVGLREGLKLTKAEHSKLLDAARHAGAMRQAEKLGRTIARYIPALVDVCIVRSVLVHNPGSQRLLTTICDLPDMAAHADGIAVQVERAAAGGFDWSITERLKAVADAQPQAVDRYWVCTYALAVDVMCGRHGQRAPFFSGTLQRAFNMSNRMLNEASQHANALAGLQR